MKRKGASLDSLASALVHFFAFHNSAPVMLKSLIQAEIYCTGTRETTALLISSIRFSHNSSFFVTDYVFVDSFASKVFTYYCQFFSQNVLKKHLEPHLQNILHNNIAIEVCHCFPSPTFVNVVVS